MINIDDVIAPPPKQPEGQARQEKADIVEHPTECRTIVRWPDRQPVHGERPLPVALIRPDSIARKYLAAWIIWESRRDLDLGTCFDQGGNKRSAFDEWLWIEPLGEKEDAQGRGLCKDVVMRAFA